MSVLLCLVFRQSNDRKHNLAANRFADFKGMEILRRSDLNLIFIW